MSDGSRWARSDRTFGPVGRLVATVLVLLPVWWFAVYAGVYGIVGLALWLPVLLPWALRDIWRRVPGPGGPPRHLSWPEHDGDGGIDERRGPSRW